MESIRELPLIWSHQFSIGLRRAAAFLDQKGSFGISASDLVISAVSDRFIDSRVYSHTLDEYIKNRDDPEETSGSDQPDLHVLTRAGKNFLKTYTKSGSLLQKLKKNFEEPPLPANARRLFHGTDDGKRRRIGINGQV